MQVMNVDVKIAVYLLCVKYSTLLLSDVVVVVHSLFLRLKLKREAVV